MKKLTSLQEAIQTVVASSIVGVSEKFKAIEKGLSDLRREIQKHVEDAGEHRLGVTQGDVDSSIRLRISELEEALPATLDGLLAAQLATPIEAILRLPVNGGGRRKSSSSRRKASASNKGKSYAKRPRCPEGHAMRRKLDGSGGYECGKCAPSSTAPAAS